MSICLTRRCLPAGGRQDTLPCRLRGQAMPIDLWRASGGKPMRDSWESTSAALVRRYQRLFAKAANFLSVHRFDGIDPKRDRFLTQVGAYADELHSQLLR